jgi:hypothetical protein
LRAERVNLTGLAVLCPALFTVTRTSARP